MTDERSFSVRTGVDGQLGADLRVAPGESESGVAVVEHTLAPERLGSPLHRHENEDEISHVLAGRMGVREGDEVRVVEAGETVVKERGVWHAFWNPGPGPLRFLEVVAPGEFAWYFEELAEILHDDAPPAALRERIDRLGDEYDFESRPGSVPELRERHGLGG
jgi:mannose-6-phosphate isomerase-like protein (cupin superfamily)